MNVKNTSMGLIECINTPVLTPEKYASNKKEAANRPSLGKVAIWRTSMLVTINATNFVRGSSL